MDLFPGTKLGIGPVIDDGFYYDLLLPRPLTPDDLPAIEARMRESIAADHPFELSEMTPAEARAFMVERDQPFKVEIIDDLLRRRRARRDGRCRRRPSTGRARSSTCAGARTSRAPARSARSSCSARPGAYWRGDEKRPMLQRIYGTAWATQEELDAYLWRREEAKKRDHRRLGVQLDLFSFHDVAPGSAFWHPKGQMIWRTLEGGDARAPGEARLPGGQHADRRVGAAVAPVGSLGPLQGQHVHRRVGEPAVQPQADELPRDRRSSIDRHLRSYRDLPLRFSEFGRLHRNERSGTLSGLTRVRQFIQDDAHLYVRPDQLMDEIQALLGEVREAYGVVRARRRASRSRPSPTRRSATRRCGSAPNS